MQLFVWDGSMTKKYPAKVESATSEDFKNTTTWQTQWTTPAATAMPNKVALHRTDTNELLGLMSYDINESGLAVEIIYIESAAHSNSNLLNQTGEQKKYIGIARALFAYAIKVSLDAGFGGVIFFRAKTTELRSYYMNEFGAVPLGQYDPFRLIVWEDSAAEILASYEEVN
ncbi:MAG: hypothetical protein IJ955_03740 [Oscillospiraceae bacterium]|nr:hypothetical protein [Oscillospiraceae bacterium]